MAQDIHRILYATDLSDNSAYAFGYAMTTISEGAVMEGGAMSLSGEADAFGHRKLGP